MIHFEFNKWKSGLRSLNYNFAFTLAYSELQGSGSDCFLSYLVQCCCKATRNINDNRTPPNTHAPSPCKHLIHSSNNIPILHFIRNSISYLCRIYYSTQTITNGTTILLSNTEKKKIHVLKQKMLKQWEVNKSEIRYFTVFSF